MFLFWRTTSLNRLSVIDPDEAGDELFLSQDTRPPKTAFFGICTISYSCLHYFTSENPVTSKEEELMKKVIINQHISCLFNKWSEDLSICEPLTNNGYTNTLHNSLLFLNLIVRSFFSFFSFTFQQIKQLFAPTLLMFIGTKL